MFAPPPGHQQALDGLRALVILWTVLMHLVYLLALHVPRRRWLALAEDPSYRWLFRGELAVDGFFVLSGYLIAYFLISEHRQSGRIAVARFYGHRLLRLSPALWVALAAYLLLDGANGSMWWSNALYLTNFVPYERQSMGWTWSLAVEEQFYLVFPLALLLLYRWKLFRLPTLLLLLVAAFAIRALVISGHDIHLPLPYVESLQGSGDPEGLPRWATYADAVYVKPHTRFGALLCGIIAAYLRHYSRIDAMLRRHPLTASLLMLLSLSAITLVVAAPMNDLSSVWSPAASLAYLAGHRYLFALAMAYLVLLALSPSGLGRAWAWFLSWRLWYPFAVTAYASYLLQPIVIDRLFYHSAKYLRDRDLPLPPLTGWTMAALFVAVALLLLLLCGLLFVLVERPFMNLRRHTLSETPVPARPAAPAEPRPLPALAPEPTA